MENSSPNENKMDEHAEENSSTNKNKMDEHAALMEFLKNSAIKPKKATIVSKINSWYSMGINRDTEKKGDDGSYPILVDNIGLTSKINLITYARQSKHLYVVVPEFPHKVFRCFIGAYIGEIQEDSNKSIVYQNGIDSIEIFDGEIIALAASSSHLYLLTQDSGRNGVDNSYMLIQQEVDMDGGFGHNRIHSIIDFRDTQIIPHEPINICVTESHPGRGYRIYFFGKGILGKILYANYHSQRKIEPNILKLKKVFGKIPKIDMVHAVNKTYAIDSKTASPAHLIAANSNENSIYTILHYKDNKIKISFTSITDKNKRPITPVAISSLPLTLKKQGIKNNNNFHHLILIACKNKNFIYSLTFDNNSNTACQLIGGGEKIIGKDKSKNLLNYKITEPINRILAIENFGFIAGSKKTSDWFTLLLPSAIKSKANSKPKKKKITYDRQDWS